MFFQPKEDNFFSPRHMVTLHLGLYSEVGMVIWEQVIQKIVEMSVLKQLWIVTESQEKFPAWLGKDQMQSNAAIW